MNNYDVIVYLEYGYRITAPDEEIAREVACRYFKEATPNIEVKPAR